MSSAIVFEKQKSKIKVEIDLANLGVLKRTGRVGSNAVVFAEYNDKRLKVQVLVYEVESKKEKGETINEEPN